MCFWTWMCPYGGFRRTRRFVVSVVVTRTRIIIMGTSRSILFLCAFVLFFFQEVAKGRDREGGRGAGGWGRLVWGPTGAGGWQQEGWEVG